MATKDMNKFRRARAFQSGVVFTMTVLFLGDIGRDLGWLPGRTEWSWMSVAWIVIVGPLLTWWFWRESKSEPTVDNVSHGNVWRSKDGD